MTEDILQRAIQGDERAFESIYKETFRFVFNVAYRIVSKKEEAEEVCQEVFMTVYRKIHTFRQQSSLKTWIYRITINCAIKYAQKKSKHTKGRVTLADMKPLAAATNDVRDKMDQEANEGVIQNMLNHLSLEQRTCIVLRSIQGLSYQEIAETLSIPLNTVRSRIKRAREAMLAMRREAASHEL